MIWHRTIWHQENLAPGQFGTGPFGTIMWKLVIEYKLQKSQSQSDFIKLNVMFRGRCKKRNKKPKYLLDTIEHHQNTHIIKTKYRQNTTNYSYNIPQRHPITPNGSLKWPKYRKQILHLHTPDTQIHHVNLDGPKLLPIIIDFPYYHPYPQISLLGVQAKACLPRMNMRTR